MAGLIKYTTTNFQTPNKIAEEAYNILKSKIEQNPFYNIVENETSSSKFKSNINMMWIGAGGLLLAFILKVLFKDSIDTLFDWISVPSVLIFLGGFIYLALESPSYNKYLKQSDAYFLRMKYAIQKSNSFFEFNEIFYSIYSSDYDMDYKEWRKQYLKDSKSQIKKA